MSAGDACKTICPDCNGTRLRKEAGYVKIAGKNIQDNRVYGQTRSSSCAAPLKKGEDTVMEERVSMIGIIVENMDSTDKLNALLHEYGSYIIGRMGIPYPKKNLNIISIALDAPMDVINTLSGKIGQLDGISSKVVCSKG